MVRWLTGLLLLCASFLAAACPLCLGGLRPSTAQQLVALQHSVLALPSPDGSSYRVVEVIKGERPSGGIIEGAAVQVDAAVANGRAPLLLARDDSWPMWISFGAIGAEHAGWLRRLAIGKRALEMNANEWRGRVALMLPYLENPEPLVGEIAYGEFATAPYAALLTVKSRLAAQKIRKWLADPKLEARQPLYILLLGIAGNGEDAAGIERRLDAAWKSREATNLGSMIAADLQLRGQSRMAWVDAKYLADPKRSTPEIEAALLALSVHGNANGVIPRERVIQSYWVFMKEHKDIAGYVAQDLAAWQYWDAVPEYAALMKSDLRQQYPSRVAIMAYLRQSPSRNVIDEIPVPQDGASQPSTNTLPASSIQLLPQ